MYFIQCPFCNCEYRIDKEIEGNTIKCHKCQKSFEAKNIYQKNRKPKFEQLAMAYELINQEQLDEAISIQKAEEQLGNIIAIEDILLQKGMIQPEQMEMLKSINEFLEMRSLDKKFGKIAVSKGFLTEEEVKRALSAQVASFKQHKYCRLIGDILIETGVLKESQRDSILMEQKRIDAFLPHEKKALANQPPSASKNKSARRFTYIREITMRHLIRHLTQRWALAVIVSITLLTVGVMIYATTATPRNFRSSVDKSLMDRIFETDKRHYLYPLRYSTTLSDQFFLTIEMEIEFTDINGLKEFESQGEAIRRAFDQVFNPRTSRQIKREQRLHSTLRKILKSQIETPITNIYISKYMLTEPRT